MTKHHHMSSYHNSGEMILLLSPLIHTVCTVSQLCALTQHHLWTTEPVFLFYLLLWLWLIWQRIFCTDWMLIDPFLILCGARHAAVEVQFVLRTWWPVLVILDLNHDYKKCHPCTESTPCMSRMCLLSMCSREFVQSHRCSSLTTTHEGWTWSLSPSAVKCVCFAQYQTLIKELSSCLVTFMILLIYFEILRFLNNRRGLLILCITVSCERTYPPGLGCSSVTVLKTLLPCSAVWFQ